jgi:dimethylamine corrinoid protein
MQVIIEDLKKAGVYSMTMVGGGPISPGFAKSICADGYAKNAAQAVKVARGLLQTLTFDMTAVKKKEYAYVTMNKGCAK